jgi:hypothetical protein
VFLSQLDNVSHRDELGGHSSVFAQRAQKEQCKVFIAAQASDFNKQTIPVENYSHHLLWPNLELSKGMEKDLDLHLVFEYNEGDVILGHRAPRSNRFYFVRDPNGASFKQMEAYHD